MSDLHELDDYWASRGEPERGEQYVRDLIHTAESHLTDSSTALRGRIVRAALLPGTREILVFNSSYRIIYRVDEAAGIVHVYSASGTVTAMSRMTFSDSMCLPFLRNLLFKSTAMTTRLLFLTLATFAAAQDGAAPAAPAPQKFDFQALAPGPVPDEYMATDQDAKFHIVADGENKILELQPQPIVDAGMLAGKSVKGACTVSARIKATGKRRTQPRFGIGLHGISGPRLRVVPATKSIEIIKSTEKEEAVATAAYAWTSGTWTRLELSVKPTADGKGGTVEARVWEDGKPRPDAPTLTWASPDPPAQGKVSVWGTPYSEQPIQFDDIEVKSP